MSVDKTTPFEDVAKALPKLSTLAGLSLLCVDTAGELKKSDAQVMEFYTSIPDVNDISAPGFYQPTADALNTPTSPNSSDQIIYLGRPTYAVMIYIPINGNRIFKRLRHAGEWKLWTYLDFTPVS